MKLLAVPDLCNGRVSVRLSLCLSVPSIAAAFRSISAAGAKLQQRAGSVSAVIRGDSSGYKPKFHYLDLLWIHEIHLSYSLS